MILEPAEIADGVQRASTDWIASKLEQLAGRIAELTGRNMDASEQVLIEAARRLRAAQ